MVKGVFSYSLADIYRCSVVAKPRETLFRRILSGVRFFIGVVDVRRYRLLLCVVLALSLMGCAEQTKQAADPIYTNGVYEVNISASLLHNNSVGNDWQQIFTCEGSPIGNRERWTVPLNTIKTVVMDTTICEDDKLPDIASGSLSVDLVDGFTASTVITVTENKGRYRGNTAEWEITCSVTLVEKVG